jgi:hypothetical protein
MEYIIPIYGALIYTIFTYYSYILDKDKYKIFFNNKKIYNIMLNIILNVYFYMPLALHITLKIQPITIYNIL